ncbi:transitional endoplasmic reticulum ATPase [Sinosporangium album]|uniref:Transitional endoplasmic reticulum ATPase n=1 Tax=Sinosporangium album TaxID=504805 RepID=A0A1G7X454_9ACTN|nr:ATP-binding protein [Sinosporangium album]SDG78952.1 transitional endoplasmic reticulum ATPase [Sinosporangium album]
MIPLRVVYTAERNRRDLAASSRETMLAAALHVSGCVLLEPLRSGWRQLPMSAFRLTFIPVDQVGPGTPLYAADGSPASVGAGFGQVGDLTEPDPSQRPVGITDEAATRLAYEPEIAEVASLLRADLSVLVVSDKIVVPYLAEHIVRRAGREALIVDASGDDDDEEDGGPLSGLPAAGSTRQRQMARLRTLIRAAKPGHVIVIPHLDLLAGGADSGLSAEAREVTELLYASADRVVLAFADLSLRVPEVLAARLSRRLALEGSPRTVCFPGGGEAPLERALVTEQEAMRFAGLESADFYKHVAGLNPVRLRQAMRYAMQVHEGNPNPRVEDLRDTIRSFKTHLVTNFEIPKITFADIGGYDQVKAELQEALHVMEASQFLPEADRQLKGEIVPRGFIFHGPAGTGKTLLAKAIANEMNGTIQVVSGPEVTSKWVGEGEGKVRELFAEARRNAPSVIVFDEFDSIAARRSSWEDGGSRAANAMVAQILTEMDGFRPDVPMLVIGTTNRIDIIDPALLRPSRFRSFHIDLPDVEGRRAIVHVHARRYHIEVGELLEPIAKATEGWNGDQIASIFRGVYIAKWLRRESLDAPEELATRIGAIIGGIQKAAQDMRVSQEGQ